jgi:hypothetical protein
MSGQRTKLHLSCRGTRHLAFVNCLKGKIPLTARLVIGTTNSGGAPNCRGSPRGCPAY